MIVPAPIRRRFDGLRGDLDIVVSTVRDTVFNFCEQNGFAYVGRTKTVESLAEKIETGRFSCWSDLDDLFGCAVVVPMLDQEETVLNFLRKAFVEHQIKSRGSSLKSPDVFRFDASRFIGTLRECRQTEISRTAHKIKFEVQIRSAFEHAWIATTHALAYKSGKTDWKTKRLAAQLKAAVEQLDSLVLAFEASREPIIEHSWPDLTARRQIAVSISEMVRSGQIPEELGPKDWSRFADNLFGLIQSGPCFSRRESLRCVSEAVACIREAVICSTPRKLPHSISLLQFAFGTLARGGILEPPLRDFCPLVTDELLLLYPEISRFDRIFLLDE